MSLFELWVLGVLCLLALHACELAWERWQNTEIRYSPPDDRADSSPTITAEDSPRQAHQAAPAFDSDADTWDEIKVDPSSSAATLTKP